MKKQLYIIFFIFVLLSSCKQAEVEYVDFDTFKPTSVEYSNLLNDDGTLNDEITIPSDVSERCSSTTFSFPKRIASTTSTDFARNLVGVVENGAVVQIAGTYTGHDIDGSPLTLSGKLVLPLKGEIKNLIVVSHYTVCANYEAPSETFPIEALFAAKGYAVVIADYIGYGVTSHRIHPYMHTESTARSVIDMALAVLPYLKHIGRSPKNTDLILVGYSQGGSTTLKVMQLLQTEHPEITIRQVYAGAGPYDLTATYDQSMATDETGIPCAIPMIVQGVNEGERLNLNMADFFLPRLLNNYSEWINSKQYTVRQINEKINVKRLSEIMTPEGRNKNSIQTARFYKALMRNSTLNFTPKSPLLLFHSREDDTVPFVNSERAEEAFKGSNVRYDFGEYGNHMKGYLKFTLLVLNEL